MAPLDFLAQNIFWPVISGILSTIVYIILTWLWRRPRLSFNLVQSDPAVDIRSRVGFYHIEVENKGKNTAQACHLTIEYKDHLSQHILTLNPGKWDKNPNPVAPVAIPGPRGLLIVDAPNPSLLHYSGEVNIKPGAKETFCYLVKYRCENECYAFNADNFIEGFVSGLRVRSRRLEPGQYLITFIISGDNVNSETTFLITNPGIGQSNITPRRLKGIFSPL